jgi:hypothetical protein
MPCPLHRNVLKGNYTKQIALQAPGAFALSYTGRRAVGGVVKAALTPALETTNFLV